MSKAIRVSIVDDEVDLRENIAGYVDAAKGFKCVGVHSNAKEALANLPAEKTRCGADGHQPRRHERH